MNWVQRHERGDEKRKRMKKIHSIDWNWTWQSSEKSPRTTSTPRNCFCKKTTSNATVNVDVADDGQRQCRGSLTLSKWSILSKIVVIEHQTCRINHNAIYRWVGPNRFRLTKQTNKLTRNGIYQVHGKRDRSQCAYIQSELQFELQLTMAAISRERARSYTALNKIQIAMTFAMEIPFDTFHSVGFCFVDLFSPFVVLLHSFRCSVRSATDRKQTNSILWREIQSIRHDLFKWMRALTRDDCAKKGKKKSRSLAWNLHDMIHFVCNSNGIVSFPRWFGK